MTGLTVVPFKRKDWTDAIEALESVIEQMKSGEIAAIESGALVMMDVGGGVSTFGFGPKNDDLLLVGLFRLGEQLIIDSCLDGE